MLMVNNATSTQIGITQAYPTEDAFKKSLQKFAQPKFGRSLLVEATGEIKETNFLRALFEMLKGLFGGCNRTNKSLVELKIIHFLSQGLTNKWLKDDDIKLVEQLAKRAGLTPPNDKAIDQHSELRQLVDVIRNAAKNKIGQESTAKCDALIEAYCVSHQKELAPFHLQITKLAQAATLSSENKEEDLDKEKSQPDTDSGHTPGESEFAPSSDERKNKREEQAPTLPAADTVQAVIPEPQTSKDTQVAKVEEPKPIAAPRESLCKKLTKISMWAQLGTLALLGIGGYAGSRYSAHTFSVVRPNDTKGLTQTTADFANTYFPNIAITNDLLPTPLTSIPITPITVEQPLLKTPTEITAMEQSLRGSLAQQLNIFLGTPPIDTDQRTLLHIVGDIFGKDTGLEGSHSSTMLLYFQQQLKQKIDALKQHGLCDEETKRAICGDLFGKAISATKSARQADLSLFEDLARKIDTSMEIYQIFNQGDSEKFHEKIKGEIAGLAAGKSFFFPGGWLGHAIVYEVVKQDNGKLTFRVYNTGAGLEYYKRAVVETETFYLPFIEIVDIPVEKFLDRAFLNALQPT